MEYGKTRLVEEDNTIYEIDLDCMRRKQRAMQYSRTRQEEQKGKQDSAKEAKAGKEGGQTEVS